MLCIWKNNNAVLSNNLDNVHFQLGFYISNAVQTSHVVHSAINDYFQDVFKKKNKTLLFPFYDVENIDHREFLKLSGFALVSVYLPLQD